MCVRRPEPRSVTSALVPVAVFKPRGKTVDIERHSRRHSLQMHLRQPAVARLAQSERADALGQRALDAGPQPIEMPLFVPRRARSGRGQRFVRLTRVKRKLASLRLRPGAHRLRGAGLTGGRTEVDFDAVAASFVLVFAPTHAVLAGGAAHALALPIYRKGFPRIFTVRHTLWTRSVDQKFSSKVKKVRLHTLFGACELNCNLRPL